VGGKLAFAALVRPLAEQVSGSVRPLIQALVGAVACVLLVACVNVANLLRRAARCARGNLNARRAGATRGRILQLASETLLLVVIASAAGGFLAGRPSTRACGSTGLAALGLAAFNWRVLVFASGATAATALLVGIIPALSATGRLRNEALKPGASAMGVRSRRLHSALVVVEMLALSARRGGC
jgi:hypothetical protein